MNHPPLSPLRQPVQPSLGGLLGREFTYRNAEKTDVRLTWQRAKENLKRSAELSPSEFNK